MNSTYRPGYKWGEYRLVPPNAQSVAQVSLEVGVPAVPLYNWRNQYRDQGNAVPADPSNPENWSGKNKLALVIETATLNEEELSVYCREKGLYVEQVRRWREAAESGADMHRPLTEADRQEWQKERKRKLVSGIIDFANRYFYAAADAIHAVSYGVKRSVAEKFALPIESVRVVYNPIDNKHIAQLAGKEAPPNFLFDDDCRLIVSVGRLSKQKDYSTLIVTSRMILFPRGAILCGVHANC